MFYSVHWRRMENNCYSRKDGFLENHNARLLPEQMKRLPLVEVGRSKASLLKFLMCQLFHTPFFRLKPAEITLRIKFIKKTCQKKLGIAYFPLRTSPGAANLENCNIQKLFSVIFHWKIYSDIHVFLTCTCDSEGDFSNFSDMGLTLIIHLCLKFSLKSIHGTTIWKYCSWERLKITTFVPF